MKQLFLASTLFEAACLAAGIDSGAFDEPALPAVLRTAPRTAGAAVDERILLVSNNATVLEQALPLDEVPGVGPILGRFDRIIRLNDLMAPLHPSSWSPPGGELPMLERLIRTEWGLGDAAVELVLESPQVNPAIALSRIFGDALIRVHADGLMSYGPTRNAIPLTMGQRLTALHYPPLVEGLRPHLLDEYGIEHRPFGLESFVSVVDEIAQADSAEIDAALSGADGATTALAVGQYLSALGVVEPEEEESLYADMVRSAADAGCTTLLFKPHPAAPTGSLVALEQAAAAAGIDLRIVRTPVIAEVLVHRLRPSLVIGVFSTLLATARAAYGIPFAAVGTEMLLDRLAPYQNSNRVPLTIIDWLADHQAEPAHQADDAADTARLQNIVTAVSYCMQPVIAAELRTDAETTLSLAAGTPAMKYFKRRRLMKLGLPGGLSRTRNPKTIARRLGGVGYRLGRYEVERIALRRRQRP